MVLPRPPHEPLHDAAYDVPHARADGQRGHEEPRGRAHAVGAGHEAEAYGDKGEENVERELPLRVAAVGGAAAGGPRAGAPEGLPEVQDNLQRLGEGHEEELAELAVEPRGAPQLGEEAALVLSDLGVAAQEGL